MKMKVQCHGHTGMRDGQGDAWHGGGGDRCDARSVAEISLRTREVVNIILFHVCSFVSL